MTAVPVARGTGLQLICDYCGDITITSGPAPHDSNLVQGAVTRIGWTGSAFARGPHQCPECAATPAAAQLVPSRAPAPAVVPDRVRVRHHSSASIVRVHGDIDLDVAEELQSGLDTALASHPYVVVDLSGAGVIDSVGLGTLVRARNAARRREGEVLLAAPSRFVQIVLRTMRLHTAFRIFDTVHHALAASRGSAPVSAGDAPPNARGR